MALGNAAQTIFQVEDVTIHRVIEAELPFTPALEFLPNVTQREIDENRDWMLEMSAITPDDVIVLCFQSYILRTPHHNILVDSCNGNHKPRPHRPRWDMFDSPLYMENFKKTGLRPEDIDYVMCTHLHADHVGWNTRLETGRWVPTFPNARYLFSEAEFAFWSERNRREPLPYMVDSVLPIVAAGRADLVTCTHELGDHIRLLPTPGHSPNHFAICLGKGPRDAAVLAGDLIHSPLQMRYPHLTMNRDYDPVQGAMTRQSFLERYCDSGALCCTAHFPSPSVARITRWGGGFRCEAAD